MNMVLLLEYKWKWKDLKGLKGEWKSKECRHFKDERGMCLIESEKVLEYLHCKNERDICLSESETVLEYLHSKDERDICLGESERVSEYYM